ncbi:MAG: hypothetical protein ACREJD_04615 [Phycisphaerales bacterium]
MQSETPGSAAEAAGSSQESIGFFFRHLFSDNGFVPRWDCGDWSAPHGWLHIISDCLIFVAYAGIPLTLMFFVMRRRDLALRGIVWLFVGFILSCGITHLVDASMFIHPAYRFLGVMKAITAVVSLTTVFALIRVMPTALTLPGIAEAHRLAQREIERCKKVEDELVRTRDELEFRGAQLTGRLHRAHHALVGSGMALVTWEAESGKIVWEAGLAAFFSAPGLEAAAPENWFAGIGEREAAELREASLKAIDHKQPLAFRLPRSGRGGGPQILEFRAHPDRGSSDSKVLTGTVSWRNADEARG